MKKIIKKLVMLVVVAVAALLILLFGGQFGFGPGRGLGFGDAATSADTSNEVQEADSSANKEITIKVVEDTIYYGDEELSDIDELRTRIVDDDAAGASFIFDSEYGIKSTMDDVQALLAELEQSVGIKISYVTIPD